ncbi:chromosome replication/partitioning protein [Borrelia puertoricensis]|uniref:chromosome replication/partitioning protein n=1 Tax=Borrelia puertoricensis TaxID=2756107 RepID=UPI001FF196E0|nr:chromosome replication/partitioning protein [Borrelia puertoricensis]UPA18415.1 chromosome replication/partitioning protein [Borrelia puertoricensis]
MSKKNKKEIILNDRSVGLDHFPLNSENAESEYESYKNRLRRITVSEINNKIEIMEILYNIRDKKLYRIDGYKRFVDFLSEFVIARSQAFLYLRLYKRVLIGELDIEEIKQLGFKEAYRKIREIDISKKRSKENLIKPLRFQLKNQSSYDFYKSNAKFTSFLLDELFINRKDFLEELLKQFKK